MSKANNANKGLIAKASISIDASVDRVWNALTNPDIIKQYMFGAKVISDWNEGSPIVWRVNGKERSMRTEA